MKIDNFTNLHAKGADYRFCVWGSKKEVIRLINNSGLDDVGPL